MPGLSPLDFTRMIRKESCWVGKAAVGDSGWAHAKDKKVLQPAKLCKRSSEL